MHISSNDSKNFIYCLEHKNSPEEVEKAQVIPLVNNYKITAQEAQQLGLNGEREYDLKQTEDVEQLISDLKEINNNAQKPTFGLRDDVKSNRTTEDALNSPNPKDVKREIKSQSGDELSGKEVKECREQVLELCKNGDVTLTTACVLEVKKQLKNYILDLNEEEVKEITTMVMNLCEKDDDVQFATACILEVKKQLVNNNENELKRVTANVIDFCKKNNIQDASLATSCMLEVEKQLTSNVGEINKDEVGRVTANVINFCNKNNIDNFSSVTCCMSEVENQLTLQGCSINKENVDRITSIVIDFCKKKNIDDYSSITSWVLKIEEQLALQGSNIDKENVDKIMSNTIDLCNNIYVNSHSSDINKKDISTIIVETQLALQKNGINKDVDRITANVIDFCNNNNIQDVSLVTECMLEVEKQLTLQGDNFNKEDVDRITTSVIDYCKKNNNILDVSFATTKVFEIEKQTKEEIIEQLKSHGAKVTDERVEEIADMVIRLCSKYDIQDLSAVIAGMMGVETGGYNFTERVMENPGKRYKGVMQTDIDIACSIYGTDKSGKQSARYADWHKKHYAQDDENIALLKQKYATPNDLYKAIQSDPELGLEVGILAFKSKLHQARGEVKKAIAYYCGNQYKISGDFPKEYFV